MAPTPPPRRFTVTERPSSAGARKKEVVVSAAEGTSISVKKCGEARRTSPAARRLHSERLAQLRAAEARAQTLEDTLVRAVGAGIGIGGRGACGTGAWAGTGAGAGDGDGGDGGGVGLGLAPDDFEDSSDGDGENDNEGGVGAGAGRGGPTLPLDVMRNDELLRKNLDLIATAAEEANASSHDAADLQRTMASAAGGAAEEAVQPVPDLRLSVPAVAPLPMQPFTGPDWRPRMRVTPEAVEAALREAVAARRAVRAAAVAASSDLRRHVESSQRAEEVLRLHELRTSTVFSPVLKSQLVGSHATASQAHSVLQRGLHDRRMLLRRRETLLKRIRPTPPPPAEGEEAGGASSDLQPGEGGGVIAPSPPASYHVPAPYRPPEGSSEGNRRSEDGGTSLRPGTQQARASPTARRPSSGGFWPPPPPPPPNSIHRHLRSQMGPSNAAQHGSGSASGSGPYSGMAGSQGTRTTQAPARSLSAQTAAFATQQQQRGLGLRRPNSTAPAAASATSQQLQKSVG